MKYLLDTNALLYIFSAPSELSARARRIVRSQSDLSVSIQYEPRGNGLCVRERDVRVKKGRKPWCAKHSLEQW